MIITNRVKISKRLIECPLNEERFNEVYRWNDAICTSEKRYKEMPQIFPDCDTVEPIEPSLEYMIDFVKTEDDVVFYAHKFSFSDFGLRNCKISTDLCNDASGELYLDELDALSASFCKNPLEEPFYVLREQDGTLHLQNKFEEFAELHRRGYIGDVWVIIADYCDLTM
jgi:hypothetical protein